MKSQIIAGLQKIMPPDAVIDIGIGAGLGEMHQWCNWHVPLALLIDANTNQVQWTKELIEQNDGWQLETSLLSNDVNIQQDFFIASNLAESGLLTIDTLQVLWPNMQLIKSQTVQTQRLEDVLSVPSLQKLREATCIWGVVDCLAALPILKGAGAELEKWSVLWVRVLLDGVLAETHQNSHLTAVTTLLEPLGYRCIEIVEENHPAIGRALFVRDWHEQQVKQLLGEKIIQLKQLKNYEKQVEQLSGEQIAQLKQLEDYKRQVEQLSGEQTAQLKQLEDYKKQVEQLSVTHTEQLHQVEDYKKQVADLQQQLQEQGYRQQLLDEEFVKAEAQVEFIKDVLRYEKPL